MDNKNRDGTQAFPVADAKLTVKILDLLQQALFYKQLTKGANEVVKNINRGKGEVVILAADANPLEILMNIPTICEEKNIPYCYVPSQAALGRACGIKRPVIACSIVDKEDSRLASQTLELKDTIDQLHHA